MFPPFRWKMAAEEEEEEEGSDWRMEVVRKFLGPRRGLGRR